MSKLNKWRWGRIESGDFGLPGRNILVYTINKVMLPISKDQILPTDRYFFTIKAWGTKGYK